MLTMHFVVNITLKLIAFVNFRFVYNLRTSNLNFEVLFLVVGKSNVFYYNINIETEKCEF